VLVIMRLYFLIFASLGLVAQASQQCRLAAPGHVRAGVGSNSVSSSASPSFSASKTTASGSSVSATVTASASGSASATPSLAAFDYGKQPIRGVNLYVS
jgi:glucan 1,3-beta-glucosidase